jgi:hypothetical protein
MHPASTRPCPRCTGKVRDGFAPLAPRRCMPMARLRRRRVRKSPCAATFIGWGEAVRGPSAAKSKAARFCPSDVAPSFYRTSSSRKVSSISQFNRSHPMSHSRRSILAAVLLAASANAWAQFDDLEVTLTPGARSYCHIIQFPEAWAMPRTDATTGVRLFFGSNFGELEFRSRRPQGTQFLVAGFTERFPPRDYTTNRLVWIFRPLPRPSAGRRKRTGMPRIPCRSLEQACSAPDR